MADPSTIPAPKPPSGARMVLAMGAVGLFASVALVATYILTKPIIEANRAEYLQQSISSVLPTAARFAAFVPTDTGFEPAPAGAESGRIFAGYAEDGSIVGLAIEAQGQGYADIIRVLYGYDLGCSCIVGLKVLESKETPGLGDKIEKNEGFQSNFEALELRTDTVPVELVKKGQKTEAWQIEAITGATVSSRAITDLLAARTAELASPLSQHSDQLAEQ